MDVIRANRFNNRRKRVSPRKDRRVFSKTSAVRRINNAPIGNMRGGTRL